MQKKAKSCRLFDSNIGSWCGPRLKPKELTCGEGGLRWFCSENTVHGRERVPCATNSIRLFQVISGVYLSAIAGTAGILSESAESHHPIRSHNRPLY